jgi:hypothetical protein
MYTFAVLVAALFVSAGQHGMLVPEDRDLVSLCNLQEHPNEYNGKTVTVKAIFVGGGEFQIFRDDACQPKANPASGKSDLIEATFSRNEYDSMSGLHKKLVKLIKKKQLARVTVIGTFIDPGKYIGHSLCCRYQLEIHGLISVEEVSQRSHARRLGADVFVTTSLR